MSVSQSQLELELRKDSHPPLAKKLRTEEMGTGNAELKDEPVCGVSESSSVSEKNKKDGGLASSDVVIVSKMPERDPKICERGVEVLPALLNQFQTASRFEEEETGGERIDFHEVVAECTEDGRSTPDAEMEDELALLQASLVPKLTNFEYLSASEFPLHSTQLTTDDENKSKPVKKKLRFLEPAKQRDDTTPLPVVSPGALLEATANNCNVLHVCVQLNGGGGGSETQRTGYGSALRQSASSTGKHFKPFITEGW